MKRYAVIAPDGLVSNVIDLADGAEWPVPAGHRLVEDRAVIAQPGGRYADAALTADPAPPVIDETDHVTVPEQMDAAIESTRALRAQREAIAAATTTAQLRTALLAALEPNPVIDDVLERTPPRGRT